MTIDTYKIGDLILVTWRDITTYSGHWWDAESEGLDEIPICLVIQTPAWYIDETESDLVLGIEQKEKGRHRYRSQMRIPKGCIVEIQKLEVTS